MPKTSSVLAAIVAVFLATSHAYAQNSVSFVAFSTPDTADCATPATTCSLARAISRTNDGGTIYILQPAGYTGATIEKSLTILAGGTDGGTVQFDEILINAQPDDIVTMRGIVIDQQGNTTNGLSFAAGAALHLQDCTIRGAFSFGINFAPSTPAELYVTNCTISDNGVGANGGGIRVKPVGSISAKVTLDNVRLENNRLGILVDGTVAAGAILVNIRDSAISGSSAFGIGAFDAGGGVSSVVIEDTTSANNGSQGIVASNSRASVQMRDSTVSGNAVGLFATGGGQIISHGGNVITGNTTNGTFSGTLPPL
jgi:hypothetical protein